MTTSVPEAGSAAPTPAAAELPRRFFTPQDQSTVDVRAVADWAPAGIAVLLDRHNGSVPHVLTPAEARLLAVYLVDCANALDNPADRVIVDEAEGIGHE